MLRFRWWCVLLLCLPLLAGCAQINKLGRNNELPCGLQRKWDEFHCTSPYCG